MGRTRSECSPELGETRRRGPAPIRWQAPDCARIAPPAAAETLIRRAVAASPDNAELRLKLAGLHLDRFDFAAAAAELEAALRLGPARHEVRQRLARCYNALRRHDEALALFEDRQVPEYQRALAFARLGLEGEAEREYRALLAADRTHHHALGRLASILERQGRTAELLELCEGLREAGVGHSQLLYVWGSALALAGRDEEARALLFDPERVAALDLPVPDGFSGLGEFNAALADELLVNPHRLSDFPADEEANRGSSRVHALLAGRRPELILALIDALQALIDAHAPARRGSFDPWLDARPGEARLRPWGLIQRSGDHEAWHSHPGGWLSGVYYVRVPHGLSEKGEGSGCIEYGPPPPLARRRPGFVESRRYAPVEGRLLLAPSHFPHRTIPSGRDEHRISFAFDVVPAR